MSDPAIYPWTARLARTLTEAREAAKKAGRKMKDGAEEYAAFRDLRAARDRKRYSRRICVEALTRTQEYLRLKDARDLVKQWEVSYRKEIRCTEEKIRCGRMLPCRLGRPLTKLGIPCRKVLRGFQDCGRWGWKPIFALLVLREEAEKVAAYQSAPTSKKAAQRWRKAAAEKEARLQEMADSLGVLRNSRAFQSYLRGEIDESECRRIGEITRHRHEETDYEELLEAGLDREDARALAS